MTLPTTNKKSWNNWADEKSMNNWANEKKSSNGLDFHKINGLTNSKDTKNNEFFKKVNDSTIHSSIINQETNFTENNPIGYFSEEDEDYCDTSDFINGEVSIIKLKILFICWKQNFLNYF